MEARLVVCSVAGSPSDTATTEVATQLASLVRGRLLLVAVAPVGDEWTGWTLADARRALEAMAERVVTRVGVDCVLELGNPTRRLVEVAATRRALLLVVAAGGGEGTPASIAAAALARRAPCPVVVVPADVGAPALDAG